MSRGALAFAVAVALFAVMTTWRLMQLDQQITHLQQVCGR